jgi:putative hydrolase of the HAD superfamily
VSTAITFDFHNTLVECDSWFDIEVHTLVSDVLRYWHEIGEIDVPAATLASADAEYRKLRQAIHRHGHELPADRAVRTILERIGFAMSWEAIDISIDAIMRRAFLSATPVEGAPQTVAELARQGIPLGIVSIAIHHDFLLWSLERFEMIDAFSSIVSSASCGFYKVRPEIYWTALDNLDATAGRSLHIGDSLRMDVGGASRAGMRTVWYQRPTTREVPSAELAPNVIVTSMSGAAPTLLETLSRA